MMTTWKVVPDNSCARTGDCKISLQFCNIVDIIRTWNFLKEMQHAFFCRELNIQILLLWPGLARQARPHYVRSYFLNLCVFPIHFVHISPLLSRDTGRLYPRDAPRSSYRKPHVTGHRFRAQRIGAHCAASIPRYNGCAYRCLVCHLY